MRKGLFFLLFCLVLVIGFSCKKDKSTQPVKVPPVDKPKTVYADSVFYIQASEVFVTPTITAAGSYTSRPDGLLIDQKTGEIEVNKSETGLKYQVTFTPDAGGDAISSFVIISGINYLDKIYNLAQGDSVAVPVYNADKKLAVPDAGNSTVFDESGGCKKAGIVVNTGDAKINLAESVRNQGIDTGATAEVKLAYRINDGSNKALNGLDVKIYFYRTAAEIPQYLTDLLNERKATVFGDNLAVIRSFAQASPAVFSTRKPTRTRPPCIIVVSR
jgi:hypothetical protein